MSQIDPKLPVGNDLFLDRIRETEREADIIVDRARLDADQILAFARSAAAETVASARLKAADSRRLSIAGAERDAQSIRDAAQAEAEAEVLRMAAGIAIGDGDAVRAVAERIVERHVDR